MFFSQENHVFFVFLSPSGKVNCPQPGILKGSNDLQLDGFFEAMTPKESIIGPIGSIWDWYQVALHEWLIFDGKLKVYILPTFG